MKKLSLILFISICLCGIVSAQAEFNTIVCDQVITGDKMPTTTMKFYQKGSNYRVETRTQGKEVVLINRGGRMITYYPQQKMAMEIPLTDDMREKMNIGLAWNPAKFKEKIDSAQMQSLGEETVEGKICDIYQYDVSEDASSKVWVARDLGWPLKSIIDSKEGKFTVEYKNLRVNEPLSDSLFELPAGVQMMNMGEMMKGVQGMMNDPDMQEKMKKMIEQYSD